MNSIVQVEVFVALEPVKCQTLANQFLKKVGADQVREVKFQVTSSADSGDIHYSALVVYERAANQSKGGPDV